MLAQCLPTRLWWCMTRLTTSLPAPTLATWPRPPQLPPLKPLQRPARRWRCRCKSEAAHLVRARKLPSPPAPQARPRSCATSPCSASCARRWRRGGRTTAGRARRRWTPASCGSTPTACCTAPEAAGKAQPPCGSPAPQRRRAARPPKQLPRSLASRMSRALRRWADQAAMPTPCAPCCSACGPTSRAKCPRRSATLGTTQRVPRRARRCRSC
mmetsp:Transcript_18898/g.36054  ORF Transcript_18898/g.36054 Transcript_18898/m.36054 type:complete len:213 (+) Transcript_18898:694-1332(+)